MCFCCQVAAITTRRRREKDHVVRALHEQTARSMTGLMVAHEARRQVLAMVGTAKRRQLTARRRVSCGLPRRVKGELDGIGAVTLPQVDDKVSRLGELVEAAEDASSNSIVQVAPKSYGHMVGIWRQ